jgi:lysophospholipase L1-like esterase
MKRTLCGEPFKQIVAIGDSITAGGNASSREKCWVSRLAKLIGEFQDKPPECVNNGIGSNILCENSPCFPYASHPVGEKRMYRDMIEHNPDLALISYGLNDMRGGTDPDVFSNTLACVVEEVKRKTGAVIVLLGVYYMNAYKRYGGTWAYGSDENAEIFNTLIRAAALESGVLFADIAAAQRQTPWLLDKDGVHANDLGHAIIANAVFEILAQSCGSLAKKIIEEVKEKPCWRDESSLVDAASINRYLEGLRS